MTTSVAVDSEASPGTTANAVGTKLCTFRWIKIEVTMSHYSSKINYRGATHPSNLSTTVAKWISLHLTSEKIEDRLQVKASFPYLSFSLFSLPSSEACVFIYFKVISYKTIAFCFPFPNLQWNGVGVLIIPEYSSSILCSRWSSTQTAIKYGRPEWWSRG